MRKIFFLFIAIAVLTGLVACREDLPQAMTETLADVRLEIAEEKTLSTIAMDAVSYYHYDAEFTGIAVNNVQQGETLDAPLIIEPDNSAYVGKFSQGYWTFTVRAYTSRNTVIYEGSQSVWIGQSTVSVKIVLKQLRGGYGQLAIDVVSLKIGDDPQIAVAWMKHDENQVGSDGSSSSANNPDWTRTEIFNEIDSVYFGTRVMTQAQIDAMKPGSSSERISNTQHVAVSRGQIIRIEILNSNTNQRGFWYGKVTEGCTTGTDPWVTMVSYVATPDHVRFVATGLPIQAGRYKLSVSVGNTFDIIDIMIIEGELTSVSGTLNPDIYFGAGIEIDEPDPVSGKIVYAGSPGYAIATTYTWVPDTGSATPNRYVWSVNGQYINPSTSSMYSTSSTFSFTPSDHGIYTISCDVMSNIGESAYDNVVVDASGASWQSLGKYILHDYGTSYGTYTTSYTFSGDPNPDSHVLLINGAGGRYLLYMGYVTGSGTASSPYIKWAPYFGGAERADAMNTSTNDRTGMENCRILKSKDKLGSPHSSGGYQVVSLGGALGRLNDDWAFAPSKDEMVYVRDAVNTGKISLPTNTFWWTSSENPSSPSEAYVLYVDGSGVASMITMSKTSTSPGLIYVHQV